MIHTFRATHCGQTFEGAEGAAQLEAHMKAHRAEPGKRGRWRSLRPQPSHKPTPWKAPKAPATSAALTAVLAGHKGHDVLEWSTDEAAVPSSELAPGDVFIWSGRTYTVDAVEGDTLSFTMKREGSQPATSGTLTRAQLEERAPTVFLVKRAA